MPSDKTDPQAAVNGSPAPDQPSRSQAQAPSLMRSTAIVGSMTMLSRVLGLVRDIVFARVIGAAAGADAFFVAFKIPNFLRRLFAEGAFAQAFVPVLSEFREKGAFDAVRLFVDHVAGCLGATLIAVVSFCVLAAPLLAILFAPGFYWGDTSKYELTVQLMRTTFPYLFLISMTGFLGAILNSYDRFAVPAVTPVFLNIVLISSAVWVAPHLDQPAIALGWGVLVAGTVQLIFQIPFVARLSLLPRPKIAWSDPAVKRVLLLMAPAMFGVSVSQINLLLDTILASFLPTGSVSWLYYSDRLTELPLGVFGVGIATVILPTLSRQFTASCGNYSLTLDWAIRTVLLIALPAAAALMLLAEPILFTLFQYGETRVNDVLMSSLSLQAYSLGLVAFMLIKVLASAYFSRQDTKTPVKIGIIAMVSNMGLNIVFVLPLYFVWSIGHVGLALATTASAFINAGLLLRGLTRGGIYSVQPGWYRFLGQLVFAVGAMSGVLIGLTVLLPAFESLVWWERATYTAMLCVAGFVVYVLALLMCGIRPSHLKPASVP